MCYQKKRTWIKWRGGQCLSRGSSINGFQISWFFACYKLRPLSTMKRKPIHYREKDLTSRQELPYTRLSLQLVVTCMKFQQPLSRSARVARYMHTFPVPWPIDIIAVAHVTFSIASPVLQHKSVPKVKFLLFVVPNQCFNTHKNQSKQQSSSTSQ